MSSNIEISAIKIKHFKKIKMAMANIPKIQTMKDDIMEAKGTLTGKSENKKRYDDSILESQNGIPMKINEPDILSAEKEKNITTQPTKIENDEIIKLKNIINGVLQITGKKEPVMEHDKKENIQDVTEKVKKSPTKEPIFNAESSLWKTVSAVEAIAKKPISIVKPKMDRVDVSDKKEIEKKSFWKGILKNFKKRENIEETKEQNEVKEMSEMEKIEEVNETKETSEEDKIIKIEKGDKSGILKPLSEKIEETSEEENHGEEARKKFEEKEYLAPENRLTLKKQEYYSSIRKKIKQKEQEREQQEEEDLKKTVNQKQKILSKSEEYKNLKQKIIKKYHIRVSSLPWKKIIIFSSFAIVIISASYFLALSYFTPKPAPPTPVITASELAMFDSIKERGEITKDAISSLGYLETITSYLDTKKEVNISKLIIIDNGQSKKMLTFREALGLIKINTDNLPENLLKTTSNSYNFFVFKTKQKTYRLGIAVKINNAAETKKIMSDWEQETNKNRMMTKVFKSLFLDDPLPKEENFIKPFNSAVYKNINIRYIHLTDKNIALNYFIYNDILVIATSKDSSFLMVDSMDGSTGS